MAVNPDPESKHISHLLSVSTLSFRFFYDFIPVWF